MDEAIKMCSTCKQHKPLSNFHRNKKLKDGYQYVCKECACVFSRAYYQKHAEQQRADAASRRLENMDRDRAQRRVYYARNRERILQTKRAKYHADPHRVKQYNHHYYRKHRSAKLAYSKINNRRWRAANPDAVRAMDQRRRARLLGNGGSHTSKEWQDLKARYDYRCLCCGRQEPEIGLTVDHVVALASGGTNDIANIQPLCLSCNCSKQDRTIDYR